MEPKSPMEASSVAAGVTGAQLRTNSPPSSAERPTGVSSPRPGTGPAFLGPPSTCRGGTHRRGSAGRSWMNSPRGQCRGAGPSAIPTLQVSLITQWPQRRIPMCQYFAEHRGGGGDPSSQGVQSTLGEKKEPSFSMVCDSDMLRLLRERWGLGVHEGFLEDVLSMGKWMEKDILAARIACEKALGPERACTRMRTHKHMHTHVHA